MQAEAGDTASGLCLHTPSALLSGSPQACAPPVFRMGASPSQPIHSCRPPAPLSTLNTCEPGPSPPTATTWGQDLGRSLLKDSPPSLRSCLPRIPTPHHQTVAETQKTASSLFKAPPRVPMAYGHVSQGGMEKCYSQQMLLHKHFGSNTSGESRTPPAHPGIHGAQELVQGSELARLSTSPHPVHTVTHSPTQPL